MGGALLLVAACGAQKLALEGKEVPQDKWGEPWPETAYLKKYVNPSWTWAAQGGGAPACCPCPPGWAGGPDNPLQTDLIVDDLRFKEGAPGASFLEIRADPAPYMIYKPPPNKEYASTDCCRCPNNGKPNSKTEGYDPVPTKSVFKRPPRKVVQQAVPISQKAAKQLGQTSDRPPPPPMRSPPVNVKDETGLHSHYFK